MRLAPCTAIVAPELIGVLAWWCLVLAGPVLVLRRCRRRRVATDVHRHAVKAEPLAAASLLDSPGGRAGRAAMTSGASEEPHPGCRAVRLSSGTLDPLCRYVDFHRRLELAVTELERRLSTLPRDRWRIEPYPLTGERGNTLLVLGEGGVFVISATYAPGHWDDVVAASRLACKIQSLLPGYPGEVQPAICHPFTPLRPRLWYRPDDHGAWIGAWLTGGDSVIEWLEHFGNEHGLGPPDLARFDELANPNWLRPAIPASPSWPPLPDRQSSRPQE